MRVSSYSRISSSLRSTLQNRPTAVISGLNIERKDKEKKGGTTECYGAVVKCDGSLVVSS